MATRMQQRRGTAADWAAQNPVLMDGEIGFETDTHMIRVGDGVTQFLNLPRYAGPIGPQGSSGAQGPQGIQGNTGPTGPAGLVWKGSWGAGNPYAVNDVVSSAGGTYRRIVAGTTATAPQADAVNWAPVALPGPQGAAGPQGVQGDPGSFGAVGSSRVPTAETTVATTYAELTTVQRVTAVCGATGHLVIMWRALATNNTAGFSSLISVDVVDNTNSSVVFAASDNDSAQYTGVNANNGGVISCMLDVGGLVAGRSYTVTQKFRASGGTSTFSHRQLIVMA